MKIIGDEIERLQKSDPKRKPTSVTVFAVTVLDRLRIKHPALDYADELMETVKEIRFHAIGSTHGKCIDKSCDLIRNAQALIAKIEGKK